MGGLAGSGPEATVGPCHATFGAGCNSTARSPLPPPNLAPDIKPDALWDGRKMVPFRAIDNPPMVPAAEASVFLADDEYVLGVTINGESRAYPTRFVWWHHVVNDTVGGVPLVVTY